jgi:glycosyltransferase involved in cell wall biosynthesis
MTKGHRTLLVVSPWDRMWSLGGGAGVSDDYHFIDGFTRAGYEIHLLVPEADENEGDDGGRSAFGDFERVRLHTYPNFFASMRDFPVAAKRLAWLPLFNAMVVPRALRLARDVRPDVVLGHSHYAAAAAWACRRRGTPSCVKLFGVMDLVHTEWSAPRYWFKNFEQLVSLKFPQDAWIILDDGTRGGEIARSRGIPERLIHFLPNGVDLDWQGRSVDRSASRSRWGVPDGAPVVLFLARMVASKRPEELVRAMPAVVERGGGDAVFVFAGDGPERVGCEALARSLGVFERARFVGTVAHDEVPALMAAADVFVSTSNLTNMALPTCEALLCGVPVVAYDVGDTATVVRTGETGVLVPDGDRVALAAGVAGVLADAAARERMSRRAAALAQEVLTGWDERIAMELEIVEGLIQAANKKGGGGNSTAL